MERDTSDEYEEYGDPELYDGTPIARAAMHALKGLLSESRDPNHCALARAVHDHIGASGLRQSTIGDADSPTRKIFRMATRCWQESGDDATNLAYDQLKSMVSPQQQSGS